MRKYLGSKEIIEVKEDGDYVIVLLRDESGDETMRTSLEYLAEISSDEPLDYSNFVNREKLFVSDKIYDIFIKHNIKVFRVNSILDNVVLSINMNTEKKLSEIFGKNYDDRTFLDIAPVIK